MQHLRWPYRYCLRPEPYSQCSPHGQPGAGPDTQPQAAWPLQMGDGQATAQPHLLQHRLLCRTTRRPGPGQASRSLSYQISRDTLYEVLPDGVAQPSLIQAVQLGNGLGWRPPEPDE